VRQLSGKVVALTGASSGIGRALAVRLVEHGARLALADVDQQGLAETARTTGQDGLAISTHHVDVSDQAAVEQFATEVDSMHGGADVIINNAGVACLASIDDTAYDDFAWVLGVNLWGTIHGVKAFLPLLRRRPAGHIVNMASINAYLPFPNSGAYNVSKFGVDAFSQTLMAELRGSSLSVSCVYLGMTKTNIARNSRYATEADATDFESRAGLSPDAAARAILHGVQRDRETIVVGVDARAARLARRLSPTFSRRLLALAWKRLDRS
jgi:NADP-dependent 3-hydroxy acid dehydrogenase YdfG